MTIIDLKSYPFLRKISDKTLWGYTDVCRTIDFQASYGSYAATSLSPLRREIQGRFQRKNLLMSRSVFMHGFRPDYPPGKSARHRDLFTISKKETVSHGHTWKSFKINSSRSQRKTRLAHICRVCPASHSHCSQALQRRYFSRRSRRNCLRSGLNNHRPLSFSVSLGTLPKEQSRRQAPYTAGSKGQYSYIHLHFGRQAARCQRPRSSKLGNRCILRNGPRLSGLRKAFCLQPGSCFFRYPGQIQYAIQKALFISSRKSDWASMRSSCHSYRGLYKQTLSRYSAPGKIQRCRHREDTYFSHEQFHLTSINHSSTVSQQVAGGAFFQMDQATPENKTILWYFRECRQDSGLDSSFCLYLGRDNEKAARSPRKPLHNFTNFEPIGFRKDRYLSIGYRNQFQKHCHSCL